MSGQRLIVGLALSPTWLRGDTWRRTDSQVERMFSLEFYAEVSAQAERAGVDFLFVPDAPALDAARLGDRPGFSTLESHTLVSALAPLTTEIGLVPTVHTLFDAPYAAARRVQTLRQLAGQRVAWNAVTALGGSENFGGSLAAGAAEQRHERASEFIAVVRALLASYPAAALRFERDTGVFAEPTKVAPIHHAGAHFRVSGPLGTPAPPGPSAPVFQAGGSPTSLAFAARDADAVFLAAPSVADAARLRQLLRRNATEAGREPGDIRALPGLSLTLADTEAQARQLHVPAPGAAHWSIVGTPAQAVQQIRAAAEAEAIDGFIALPSGAIGSIKLFLEQVLPELSTIPFLRRPNACYAASV